MQHLILGAGPVGLATAAALARDGHGVTVVSRRRPRTLAPGVHHAAIDVLDRRALATQATGSDVVYQCLAPPYHAWHEFPSLQDAALAAAASAKARYVSFENVYAYGDVARADETTVLAPVSAKGEIRRGMIAALRDAGVPVAHVRASDLFGPGMRAATLGDEFIGRAVRGRRARGYGDLDAAHSWAYTIDAATTLARVGCDPARFDGQVWHVPATTASQRELAQLLGVEVARTPAWLLRVVGAWQPAARAMVEMLYQYERPRVVDDAYTRRALGVQATPLATAFAATAAAFRQG